MSEVRNRLELEGLNFVQRTLVAYAKKHSDKESEIFEYHSTMERITDKMQTSDKEFTYAKEVINKCTLLAIVKEYERVLIEYKFMVDNLKKQYNL